MTERLILFSQPSPELLKEIAPKMFPEFIQEKKFAYMPSEGNDIKKNEKFTPIWRQFAEDNKAKFIEIDNSKRGNESALEANKILSANILMIAGGNTFKLINNLRQSGLDKTIIEFWSKGGVVLSGFSAGAIVITPSVKIANNVDLNEIGLTDMAGLNIINFEVWPHYTVDQVNQVNEYILNNRTDLKLITNEEYLIFDK